MTLFHIFFKSLFPFKARKLGLESIRVAKLDFQEHEAQAGLSNRALVHGETCQAPLERLPEAGFQWIWRDLLLKSFKI